ncbi:unnamed protein product, partial [Allacma fusca]
PTTTHTEIAVSNATSQNLEMITDLPGSHQDCWILLITFNWCATVGSRDYKHHARWLLCRIFVQSVSVNINWTGILKKRAPKRAFKGMNIYNVVIPQHRDFVRDGKLQLRNATASRKTLSKLVVESGFVELLTETGEEASGIDYL